MSIKLAYPVYQQHEKIRQGKSSLIGINIKSVYLSILMNKEN